LRSFSEEDTRAMFEALCRVERQTAGAGAGASRPAGDPIELLRREIGATAPAEDDFPDFEKERAAESDPPVAPVAPPPAAAGSDRRDRFVRALVGALASYRGLLERYHRALDDAFPRGGGGGHDDDAGVAVLREAQAVLVKYPIAAQAAFAALVREGRRFAATDDGRAWKSRLAGSPLVAQARTLFESLAGGLLDERGGALPSAYADALIRALDRDLERVLDDLGGGERRP
jgi:hypothetical protein